MTDTVVLAAGWESITAMIDSNKAPMMVVGGSILTLCFVWAAIKIGAKGKGKLREGIEEVGVLCFAGLVLGLALTLPLVMSSLGVDIGNSSNSGGGNVSTVQGQ